MFGAGIAKGMYRHQDQIDFFKQLAQVASKREPRVVDAHQLNCTQLSAGVDQIGEHRSVFGGASRIGLLMGDCGFDRAKFRPVLKHWCGARRHRNLEQACAQI